MTIAIELGAFALRSLRRRGDELVARSCRTIAASVKDNESRRRLLQVAQVPYLMAEDYLVLPGDWAVEAIALFETLPRALLPGGEIPKADPVSRQVLSILVEGLLPWSEHRQEVCCFVQPGHGQIPVDSNPDLDLRLAFFSRLIRLRGYEPLPLNPATGLVLAELRRAGFSGVGLMLGASGCDVAIVHCGHQLACGRLARGGAWIDEQLARRTKSFRRDALGELVLDTDGARLRKEAAALDRHTDDDRLVTALYRNLIAEFIEVMCETLASNPRVPLLPQPLPIVCSGGPAQIAGFSELFRSELDRQPLSVSLGTPRVVADQAYTVVRGCLIRAELEQSVARQIKPAQLRRPRNGAAGARERRA